jgi:hypothetical protein
MGIVRGLRERNQSLPFDGLYAGVATACKVAFSRLLSVWLMVPTEAWLMIAGLVILEPRTAQHGSAFRTWVLCSISFSS